MHFDTWTRTLKSVQYTLRRDPYPTTDDKKRKYNRGKWEHLLYSFIRHKLWFNIVYYPLPEFQLRRLQLVQLEAASFVLNKYVNDINDIVKIGWLPVRHRRDFHALKLVHQALYSPSWPSYVPLDTVKHLRALRSGIATRLIIPMERGTF